MLAHGHAQEKGRETQDGLGADIEQQQETMIAPIQEKLMNAVKEVGVEGDYVYILDESSVAFKGSMAEDITDKVKTKLGITQ